MSSEALADLVALGPPVHAVRGNMDEPALRSALPERLVVDAEGLQIGLVHDAGLPSGRAARLSSWFPGCDVIAYGHSHLPEIVRAGPAWVVNPGSPTERRRAPAHTMVAIRDGVPELVVV